MLLILMVLSSGGLNWKLIYLILILSGLKVFFSVWCCCMVGKKLFFWVLMWIFLGLFLV